jgi:transcription factor C subunit 3
LTNEVISGVLTSQPDDQTNVIIRPRVNVSNLRRENELMRVIQDLGGIVNYHTKEFVDAHAALIRTMAKSGEPTSAPPDVRIDKRTAGTTLTNLENRGRVKTLKTSLKTPTGLARPACIVYLPDIPQDKINAFLGDLSRSVTCVPQPIKVDNGSNQIQYNSLPLQLLHMDRLRDNRQEYRKSNAARANQLFSYDDLTIRNVLLTEKTTLGQLYGFIVPKARRARELHLSTINAFENGTLSPNIVSLQHRIVHLSYFYQDIALSTYCALVSPLNHTEELTQFLGTETGSQTPVRDIPHNLYNIVLQVGRARARSRILDIMEMLRSLKLVTPLQPSTSATPLITCAIHRDHPTAFDVASWEGWTVGSPALAPIYWRFNIDVPLHFWVLSETSPPFWKDVPVASRADAEVFWGELRDACMNRDYPHINADPRTDSITGPLDASSSAARSLRRAVSWNDEYILTWHQKQYLMRFVDISTGNTPLQNELNQVDQMQNICWVISAPRDVATDFFVKARAKMVRAMDRTRKKTKRPSAADKARQVNEAKALLLKKAAEAKTQREQDWEGIVLRVHAEPLKGPAAVRVRRVRSRFLQSTFVKDVQRWENEIIAATQEATMPVTTTFKRPKPAQRIATPPITVNPPEKSIETLIAQQGPPLLRHTKNKRKRTGNNEDNDPTEGLCPCRSIRSFLTQSLNRGFC